jgi:hypothetical protein
MKYADYITIPNFEKHTADLLEFRRTQGNTGTYWDNYQDDEIEHHFPNLVKEFKDSFNLTIIQLVFFSIPPNDIWIKDPLDPKAVYIHVDGYNEEHQKYIPKHAINLPLEYCEGTLTFFYKLRKENAGTYYTVFDCEGISPNAVEQVEQIEISKPAIIRVDVPHGVWNPNSNNRLVVTLRFAENLDHML